MKKLFTLAFILSSLKCMACDVCGCSAGNYFIGPFPQFKSHFLGLRYTFRSYESSIVDDPAEFSNDLYQTIELWAGWNVTKKIQLLAFLPYNFNRQHSDEGTASSNGPGDASVIANYQLFHSSRESSKGVRTSQQFWVGAGVKLPTGKFNADPDDITASANNQTGSGSTDVLVNALYSIHLNDWGLNATVACKHNTSARDFQFGDRATGSLFGFRTLYGKHMDFSPNAGLLYEHVGANEFQNEEVENTGGFTMHAAVGLELSFGKVSAGFNVQLPVAQNLSADQTRSKIRGMTHVTFMF